MQINLELEERQLSNLISKYRVRTPYYSNRCALNCFSLLDLKVDFAACFIDYLVRISIILLCKQKCNKTQIYMKGKYDL